MPRRSLPTRRWWRSEYRPPSAPTRRARGGGRWWAAWARPPGPTAPAFPQLLQGHQTDGASQRPGHEHAFGRDFPGTGPGDMLTAPAWAEPHRPFPKAPLLKRHCRAGCAVLPGEEWRAGGQMGWHLRVGVRVVLALRGRVCHAPARVGKCVCPCPRCAAGLRDRNPVCLALGHAAPPQPPPPRLTQTP